MARQYRNLRASRSILTNVHRFPDPLGRSWLIAFAVLTVLVGGTFATKRHLESGTGLVGHYSAARGSPGRSFESVDPDVTTRVVRARASRIPGGPLAIEWRGYLTPPADGFFTIGVAADGVAQVYLDGRLAASSRPGVASADAGPRRLAALSHAIVVRYEVTDRPPSIELLWNRADAQGARKLPPALLSPRPSSRLRVNAALSAPWVVGVLCVCWQFAFGWLVFFHPIRWLRAMLAGASARVAADSGLLILLATSTTLNTVAFWWGLPSRRGWAPDEIIPENIIAGLTSLFANGWHEIYPPLPFATLGVLSLPVLAVALLAGVPLSGVGVSTVVFVISRMASLAAAAGTLLAVYACGRRLAGPTAALVAGWTVALMPAFVYYGKLANVEAPCLFWFAASLYFYVRAWFERDDRALVLFAVTAALAVVTKDQAYGFYVLPAVVLGVRARRSLPAFRRAILIAALTAAGTFVFGHNLVSNPGGFRTHLTLVLGDASSPYRMWPSSLSGHVAMFGEAVRQVIWLLGWPAASLVLVAALFEMSAGRWRRTLVITLPAVSYYVFFIAAVGYLYDRFMLGPALVLALVAGVGAGEFGRATRRWRGAVAGLVALGGSFMLLRAASVDALMLCDSRYAAEQWMADHIATDAVAAATGPLETLPRAERRPVVLIRPNPDELVRVSPRYVVVNADRLLRYPQGTGERRFYQSLRSGSSIYRIVFRAATRGAWWPLTWETAMRGPAEDRFTNLDKISPAIEVYERNDRR